MYFFFFQAEDGIRYPLVTGVQTCALPIYNLRFFIIKRDAIAKPRARLKFLGWRDIYVDADWTIMKQIHAVFEPGGRGRQNLARRRDGKRRHRRQRATKVGYLLPLNCLRFDDAREMLGCNGDTPVRFDKAFEFFGPWHSGINDWHRHDYFAITRTGDTD